MIAGILLAAGQSRRAGRNKLLVRDRNGIALVRHAASALVQGGCAPLVAVLGHEAESVRAALGAPWAFVVAPAYRDGLSASLKAGLAALPAEAPAALVALGDMPFVKPETIAALAAAHREGCSVVPVFAGARGNPVLLDRSTFAGIASLAGDRGGRDLLAAAINLPVDDPGILQDCDTPETLAAFASLHRAPVPMTR